MGGKTVPAIINSANHLTLSLLDGPWSLEAHMRSSDSSSATPSWQYALTLKQPRDLVTAARTMLQECVGNDFDLMA
jgi:hypothetical protein